MASVSGAIDVAHHSQSTQAFRDTNRSSRPAFRAVPQLPLALPVPFRTYNNKYDGGSCYVVGRGPTDFDYNELVHVTDPIFFINDAVALEKYAGSEKFFFAHDEPMRVWLDGSMKAAAVLPIDGKILGYDPGVVLGHAGPVVYYRRGEQNREELLRMSRDEIADREELFVHSGTIHSLLHFIWFCGFRRVVYIGCDGINQPQTLANSCRTPDGYDCRLPNRSGTSPWWQYSMIRRAQDLLTTLFGIEAVYRGTPAC